MNLLLAMMFPSGLAGNCLQMQKTERQRLLIKKKNTTWGEAAAMIAAASCRTWLFCSHHCSHPRHIQQCEDRGGTVSSTPADPAGKGGRGGGSIPGS